MSGHPVANAASALAVSTSRVRLPGFARRSKDTEACPRYVDTELVDACSHVMRHLGGPKVERLGVLSSVRGEGRSSIATAIAFAQARDYGRTTLLLDADFDGPGLANRFGVNSVPGISDVVRGRASVDNALRQVGEGVTLMAAGEVGTAPSRLANELVASGLLSELQMDFEAIVADLPALLGSPTGVLLAEAFENPLLVIRAETTPISRVREATSSLQSHPVVILNGTRTSMPRWLRRFFS
jgi:Mrp family chromosome partitioning ATPase